jgi:hypothetical protein
LVQSRIIAGYFFSHFSLNSAKASSAACSEAAVETGVRSAATTDQSFFEAYVNELRNRCTIQVCTMVWGQTAAMASGRPFRGVADHDQAVLGASVLDL